MALQNQLLRDKSAIVDCWFERILATYPPETAKFLRGEPDRFQNPVGQTMAPALDGLCETILTGGDRARLQSHLDDIIRIRAVQDFTAAGAVGFVFQLKQVIREQLGSTADLDHQPELQSELRALDERIDQVALMAFDIYMECRQQLYEIRTKEIQRRTAAILRHHNYVVSDDGPIAATGADD
jgi:hypothetical protein